MVYNFKYMRGIYIMGNRIRRKKRKQSTRFKYELLLDFLEGLFDGILIGIVRILSRILS